MPKSLCMIESTFCGMLQYFTTLIWHFYDLTSIYSKNNSRKIRQDIKCNVWYKPLILYELTLEKILSLLVLLFTTSFVSLEKLTRTFFAMKHLMICKWCQWCMISLEIKCIMVLFINSQKGFARSVLLEFCVSWPY